MIFPGEIVQQEIPLGSYHDRTSLRASKVLSNLEDTLLEIKSQIVPTVSNLVMCRVIKTTFSQAQAHILSVEGRILKSAFLGIIRLQDIRKHEIEKIVIEECFQPGDIVQARVISLGDSKWFYLSTAEPELGVILAWDKGKRLLPHSWEDMIDPETQVKFLRKVAKPLILT